MEKTAAIHGYGGGFMTCQLVTRTVQEISVLPILMVSVVVPRPMA